jgi:hypothetical protein
MLGDQYFLDSGFVFVEEVPFEVDPLGHAGPDLVVVWILELLSDVEEDFVAGTYGVVKVGKAADSRGFPLADKLVDVFGLHGLLDGHVVLLVVCIGAFDVLDEFGLGLEGRVVLEAEEVRVAGVPAQDLQGHPHRGDLELYYEVHKYLVLVLLHRHPLPALPELLRNPVRYYRHVLQVLHERTHARHFLRKHS